MPSGRDAHGEAARTRDVRFGSDGGNGDVNSLGIRGKELNSERQRMDLQCGKMQVASYRPCFSLFRRSRMKKMICAAYLSGRSGQSIGMFYFADDVVVGVDVGGITYDGHLSEQKDGRLVGAVKFVVPSGGSLITGMTAGETQELVAEINFPLDFAVSGEPVRIETPAGPVAARFELLRELN